MPKSLSEIQRSADVGRPELTHAICVAGKLVKERDAVDSELLDIAEEIATLEQAERSEDHEPAPRRMGQPSRLAELRVKADEAAARSDAIRERMEDHTISLLLRGKTNGEWRQWATKNPPRDEEKDPAGFKRDLRWSGAACNIDNLIAALGDYIVKYGDEDPANGSWEFIANNASPGDLTMLASKVVGMHEQVVDLGKSRQAWLATRRAGSDSE